MIEEIVFTNNRGYKLAGHLHLPVRPGSSPVVVFAHATFERGKHSTRGVPIAEKLVDKGIAAFLFDFTGYGQSEGTRQESTAFQQLDDLANAIAALSEHGVELKKLGLHGTSSGCLPCLYYCLEHRVAAMVLRSARTDGLFPELYRRASDIKTPTLFIQGSRDRLLPYTRKFMTAMTAPTALRIIKGADHRFTNMIYFDQALTLAIEWFQKRLQKRGAKSA